MQHRSWLGVFFTALVGFAATPSAALQASDPAAWLVHASFERGEVGAYIYPEAGGVDPGDAPCARGTRSGSASG
jgi:hypothetical protein